MKETIVKISMLKTQIVGNIFAIIVAAGAILLHVLFHDDFVITVKLSGFILFMISLIGFIILHEFVHLLGYRIFGKVKWHEMKWGFNWKQMAAYAHAKKEISVAAMKKTLLLPFLPTGVLPLLIGLLFNIPAVTLLGSFLVSGCLGDFILYRKLQKFSNESMVKDHPTKPEFTIIH
jgi:hypothetical protein